MADSGIPRIDELLAEPLPEPPPAPIGVGDDTETVGAVQDLLGGYGYNMPLRHGKAWGRFGPATAEAVVDFQTRQGLRKPEPPQPAPPGKKKRKKPPLDPATVKVDSATLRALTQVPQDATAAPRQARARAAHVYVTRVLGFTWDQLVQAVCLTALHESFGRFWYPNTGWDKQGLSFGVIHWAQAKKRLHSMIQALRDEEPVAMKTIFGSDAVLDGVLAHLNKPNGGIEPEKVGGAPNPNWGKTTDPRHDFVNNGWLPKFRATTLPAALQQAQMNKALADYRAMYRRLVAAVTENGVRLLHSERALTFFLDLANQFGEGSTTDPKRRGAIGIFRKIRAEGVTEEKDLLSKMADEAVRRQKGQDRARRDFFLHALSPDVEFQDP